MKIGIIGTGSIGGTLARKLRVVGHTVKVANSKGLKGVQHFADEIDAIAADIHGAVVDVDLIILSIPLPAMTQLPVGLFDVVPQGVPIVDTSNYYPGMRDAKISEIEAGMPESVWVSTQIGRPVIKAFNTILAYSLSELGRLEGASDRLAVGRLESGSDRLAVAVAGDDVISKQVVMTLVNEMGFDPVDAGLLDESWRLQPSTPAYCCDYDAQMMRKGIAAAIKGEAPKKRDSMPELFAKLGANPSHKDIIAMNRAFTPL